jgi:hypothetical protein
MFCSRLALFEALRFTATERRGYNIAENSRSRYRHIRPKINFRSFL